MPAICRPTPVFHLQTLTGDWQMDVRRWQIAVEATMPALLF